MEHRWGHRVSVQLPVIVSTASHARIGWLSNVSSTGAYVRVSAKFRPLAGVQIRLVDGLQAYSRLHGLFAYIVRESAHGIGIEWMDGALPEIYASLAPLSIAGSASTLRLLDRVLTPERTERTTVAA